MDSFCLVSVKPDPIPTGLRVVTVCLCLLKGQTPVDDAGCLGNVEAENLVGHGRVVVNFVNCSRSKATIAPQCCPSCGRGAVNLNAIADPYQLAGLKVGSDVENHGRVVVN